MPHNQNKSALTGILLFTLAWQIIPVMDTIAKYLGSHYHLFQVVWSRFFFNFLFVAPIALYQHGVIGFRVPRIGLQLMRGGFLLGATMFFFAAIRFIPLTNAISIVFLAPVMVTGLSPWLLKEKVPLSRWVAVLIGFVAVLIIIRPGLVGFQPASLLVLVTTGFFCAFLISTRVLAGSAPPIITLGYQSIVGMLVMTVAIPFVWEQPTMNHWLLMLTLGFIASFGHFLVVKAFEYADASLLAPFNYTEIVMTTVLGYIFFGEFPDLTAWVGIVMIIATAVYISWPNRSTMHFR